jgi:hypothetical protein
MAPGVDQYNFTVKQRAVIDELFTWVDESTGLPVDLTGWSARLQARVNVEDEDVVMDLSTTAGTILLGGTFGTVHLSADPVFTEALDFERAFYDLYVLPPNNARERLLKGVVTLDKAVTRAD